jgi:hypothetical protein
VASVDKVCNEQKIKVMAGRLCCKSMKKMKNDNKESEVRDIK